MYWADLLTRDFIKTLKKPVMIELSSEMLTDEKSNALLKTVAYLSMRNLKGILLLVHDSENARQICRFAVKNSEFREWLSKYEFAEMKQIVENWARFY